jgi:selenide,water dikinase
MNDAPRLTTLVHGGGCSRKLPEESLVQVLKQVTPLAHPWIDARPGPLDDAAVARMPGAARSMVLTVDVITAIVDDPRAFGQIAATNAMSDVWAMGGRPELAVAFVGFPNDVLPLEVLAEIMAGLNDAAARAGCAIVGGHTIGDNEPKCGLTVIGSVDPGRVWSQRDARAGQALILTKAIGTGIVSQAVRAGRAPESLLAAAVASMTTLNDKACEIGLEVAATSCTDITGFGLLGHLKHIIEASGVSAELVASKVPFFDGVAALAAEGLVPGGSKRNFRYAAPVVDFDASVSEVTRTLLADAQTSGGLLLAVPRERAGEAVERLHAAGATFAAEIGTLEAPVKEPRIHVSA